ncbi:MAG: cupin domain-containing protein [Deltaproteobacteria bacterium]|nr:cupin domain-containing protein [Deltaproteobacteria bacterium]
MKPTKIEIEHDPAESRLNDLGVREWPIWTKEASTFPWEYDAQETCYFLEGEVVVTPKDGQPVSMGRSDLVTFPQGMECTWEIKKAVRKHYTFG